MKHQKSYLSIFLVLIIVVINGYFQYQRNFVDVAIASDYISDKEYHSDFNDKIVVRKISKNSVPTNAIIVPTPDVLIILEDYQSKETIQKNDILTWDNFKISDKYVVR